MEYVQRLRRDGDGTWWLVDADAASISRNSAGWLTGGRYESASPVPRPVAVATAAGRVAVLDSELPGLLVFTRDGTLERSITGLQRASDVVALADGTWAVAERLADLALRGGSDDRRGGSIEEMSLEDVEAFLIKKALARYDGNVSRAAEALGLSRSALYRRLQRFGL